MNQNQVCRSGKRTWHTENIPFKHSFLLGQDKVTRDISASNAWNPDDSSFNIKLKVSFTKI